MKFDCLVCGGHAFGIDGPSFVNDATPVVTFSCPLCMAYHAIEHRPGAAWSCPSTLTSRASRTRVRMPGRPCSRRQRWRKRGPSKGSCGSGPAGALESVDRPQQGSGWPLDCAAPSVRIPADFRP